VNSCESNKMLTGQEYTWTNTAGQYVNILCRKAVPGIVK
jgi:hypothetical protein